jgi:BirA family transcriptional regulator, biotin operon repressor / biotin---[acetyl-CoA-carboxylase] ligase
MLPEKLMTALEGIQIPALRYFDSLSSSNDEALSWAQSGALDGALVVADQQTQGRGRLGRTWVTTPGTALAFSLVIIPTQSEADHFALFSPLGALAVCLALEKNYGLKPVIKWPNDVLLNKHKVCGVLAEASWDGQKLLGVVLGIGINVAHNALPPVNQLRFPATSIETVYGQPVERWWLLNKILEEIHIWRNEMSTDRFFQTWQERLAFREQSVIIENTGGKTISGKLLGIDAQGNLRLLNNNNEEIQISAGDVSLRPGNDLGNTQRGE